MAATVDLGQQFQLDNVKHLPPRPPSVSGRPCSGGFQNRGRLFSTLRQQLTSDGIHAQQTSTEQSCPPPPVPNNTPKTSPLIHRRVQSAKARLEMCNTQNHYPSSSNAVAIPGKDLAVYDVNKNLTIERKPARRSSRSLGGDSNQFIHHNISWDKSANRPSSAKSSCWTSAPISLAVEPEEKEEKVAEDLKPSVFGYRLKRQVYGSNPDIFTSGLLALQPATMFKLDETYEKPSKKDHAEGNPDAGSCSRNIPSHMEPLRPWLNHTVSQEVIGADPTNCFVFLPLNQTYDDLPIVQLS